MPGQLRPAAACLGLCILSLEFLSVATEISPSIWAPSEAAKILSQLRGRKLGESGELVSGKRGMSPRPLFDQIADKYGKPKQQHRQRYHASLGRRLAGDTLTAANTAPIRFHLNFDTLDEEKVQGNPLLRDRYCFRAGDWYRVGHPKEQKPTASGPDDCDRDLVGLDITHENKWCLCRADDAITPELKRLVVESTSKAVADVPKYLGVRPVQGQLAFEKSEGSYPGMWAHTEQQGVFCDADCAKGSHVVVPDVLCDSGVIADVVLSVAVPPAIPGVGGTGSFCSSDQNGRPLHLIFNWHKRPDLAQEIAFEDLVADSRGLVLHEVLHGLGFGTGLWQNSFGSSGQRRQLLQQRKVIDSDGSEDAVYHFVKGTRTYEAAKAYFGCVDEEWQGLPLMGWPPSGRDSHHETRIMRDDVMSYGDGNAVSAITLASFEDTGHYIANYSNADCMFWGRGRGCSFVTSRCEHRPSVQAVTGLSASDCARTWSTEYSSHNSEALQKCSAGCNGESRISDGKSTCDVECFTGNVNEVVAAGSSSCQETPPGDVETAGPEAWVQNLAQEALSFDGSLSSIVRLAPWVLIPLNIIFWGLCFKRILCPADDLERSTTIFYVLTGFVAMIGVVVVAGTSYMLYEYDIFSGYVSKPVVCMALAAGVFTMCFAAFGIHAVKTAHQGKMILYLVVGLLSLLTFVCAAGLSVKYVQDMENFSRSSLAHAGKTGGAWAEVDGVQGEVYKHMESFACRTYQTCCEPNELFDLRAANGAPRQCKSQHEGVLEDAAFILSDPSHAGFCPLISGIDQKISSSSGICNLIESAADGGFTLAHCRQDYCEEGLEGYENFLSVTLAIYRKNMKIAGIVAGSIVAFMCVQLINLVYICKSNKESAVTPVTPCYSDEDLREDPQ